MLLNRRMRVRIWNREGRCSLVREAWHLQQLLLSFACFLALGANGPNNTAAEVRVDLTNATVAGTYTADITANVALR